MIKLHIQTESSILLDTKEVVEIISFSELPSGELFQSNIELNVTVAASTIIQFLIVNEDAFNEKDLKKAGYESNPLEDESLDGYKLIKVKMTKVTRTAVEDLGLSVKESDRCRNFFAMGLTFWLYGRTMDATLRYIDEKFGKRPAIADANRRALKAGYFYGETLSLIHI